MPYADRVKFSRRQAAASAWRVSWLYFLLLGVGVVLAVRRAVLPPYVPLPTTFVTPGTFLGRLSDGTRSDELANGNVEYRVEEQWRSAKNANGEAVIEVQWVASVVRFDPEKGEFVSIEQPDPSLADAVFRAVGRNGPSPMNQVTGPLPRFISPGNTYTPHYAWFGQRPAPSRLPLLVRAGPGIGLSALLAVLVVLPYVLYKATRVPTNACAFCWYSRAGLRPEEPCPECGRAPHGSRFTPPPAPQ